MADEPRARHKKNRLEAFSDGVFAIAITLLVLEIAVPAITKNVHEGDVVRDLAHEWPVYLAYFVSFMTIGAIWIEHSALVDALDSIDGVFMRLNLVLLLFCAFLPFPTRMMSEWAGNVHAERVAVVIYGVVLLMMTLMLLVLGRHAEREGLFGDDLADERRSSSSSRRASSATSSRACSGSSRRRRASSSSCSSASGWRFPSAMCASCSARATEPAAPRS